MSENTIGSAGEKKTERRKIPRLFLANEDLEFAGDGIVLSDISQALRQRGLVGEEQDFLLTGTTTKKLRRALAQDLVFAATVEETRSMIESHDPNGPVASARTETDEDETPMIAIWDPEKLTRMSYSSVDIEGNPDLAYEPLSEGAMRDALVAVFEFVPEQEIQERAAKIGKVAVS